MRGQIASFVGRYVDRKVGEHLSQRMFPFAIVLRCGGGSEHATSGNESVALFFIVEQRVARGEEIVILLTYCLQKL